MLDYSDLCRMVQDIAREAGEYIRSQRETFSFGNVEFKGAHNLVSYVDKEAERMVIKGLSEILPGSGFLAEEGGGEYGGQSCKWIIDPLDGTTNFVHGLPPYCVSIALEEEGEIVLGVVYEITLREMFYAWKGSDAWMNGRKIAPSKVDDLGNSLVAIGFSYSALQIDNFLDTVADYQRNTDGIRRLGSAATDLVYVACGRFDAYAQVNLAPWDVAAGAFIARRAGACVSDYSGGGDYVYGKQVVAATPLVYNQFMGTVK